MMTKDITGTYDYERLEAQAEANYFTETILPERTEPECRDYALKIAAHWSKCLEPAGFADFCSEWNMLIPDYQI